MVSKLTPKAEEAKGMIANYSFVAIIALLAALGLAIAVLIATPSNPIMLLAWMGIALVVAIVAQFSPRRI